MEHALTDADDWWGVSASAKPHRYLHAVGMLFVVLQAAFDVVRPVGIVRISTHVLQVSACIEKRSHIVGDDLATGIEEPLVLNAPGD